MSMMSEDMKKIFEKGVDEMTEEDRATIKKLMELFIADVEEVCRKHGLAYKAILRVTSDGVVPMLDIVRIVEAKTEKEATA